MRMPSSAFDDLAVWLKKARIAYDSHGPEVFRYNLYMTMHVTSAIILTSSPFRKPSLIDGISYEELGVEDNDHEWLYDNT